ncbi:hypothetical protein [Ralstonia chuxiongensis]|uniref:hypothetical protein n=1 Tax=Ralstonia chuxiongensis TaxID=2957504 RepID=UPI0028F610A1|nr:hypothetical protein [Ralstonia chuxiongensis]CAJ0777710.1 hypothetical protein R8510_04400 [Ralstonia chuxiongensis]
MSAIALLANLKRAGFKLSVRGDKIRVTPALVPKNIVEAIKENKSALLDCLKNEAINMPGYPVKDGPFIPWCAPLTPEDVVAIRAEMVELIGKLAAAEGWTEVHRVRLVETVHRQPLSNLRDDLTYFRARWKAVEVLHRAAEVGRNAIAEHNANRKCSTCRHMEHHETGVPIRCAHGRALGLKHHAWLDAPDSLNPCPHHQVGKR